MSLAKLENAVYPIIVFIAFVAIIFVTINGLITHGDYADPTQGEVGSGVFEENK